MSLQFRDKHGELQNVVTHRDAKFERVPMDVRARWDRKARAGTTRANEHAEEMLRAFEEHFGDHDVVSAEACALAFFEHTGTDLTRKQLHSTMGYLVKVGKLARRTRGYFQLMPSDYIPENKPASPAKNKKGNGAGKKTKAAS